MTTTVVYSDAADGQIESSNAVYATARTGGTLSAAAAAGNFGHGQSEFFGYRCYEGFLSFDTSGIADTDTVSAVELALYGQAAGTRNFISRARTSDWGASLTTADWVSGASLSGLTLQATYDTSVAWSTSDYNAYTSEAGFPAAVNKTGTTYLLLSSSRHEGANTPGAGVFETVNCYSADDSGTTRDPKLTVTHAGAGNPWYSYAQM